MSNILDSLKSLISSDMISKASAAFGEKESKVSSAVSSIIPGLLGGLIKKGDTPQLRSALEQASNTNILPEVSNIFSGNINNEQQQMGDKFLQNVFGNNLANFTSSVASDSGITNVASNKLTSMVAIITAGFLGKEMGGKSTGFSSLLSNLNSEKSSILSAMPSSLTNMLGLSSMGAKPKVDLKPAPKKKSSNWLTWLILILLFILVFFWWRSCNRRRMGGVVQRATEIVDTAARRVVQTATTATEKVLTQLELPNGIMINAFGGGIEDRVIAFLKSDTYKNATNNELRNHWFEFDNIEFEVNSTTQLMGNSRTQVGNIAAIMKAYPDTKIRIAGFADKTGSRTANMAISKKRAEHIKALLVEDGILVSRISTEGFGEEHAIHPVTDSDIERARDRDIAIYFIK